MITALAAESLSESMMAWRITLGTVSVAAWLLVRSRPLRMARLWALGWSLMAGWMLLELWLAQYWIGVAAEWRSADWRDIGELQRQLRQQHPRIQLQSLYEPKIEFVHVGNQNPDVTSRLAVKPTAQRPFVKMFQATALQPHLQSSCNIPLISFGEEPPVFLSSMSLSHNSRISFGLPLGTVQQKGTLITIRNSINTNRKVFPPIGYKFKI
jgi:hypothetical protein